MEPLEETQESHRVMSRDQTRPPLPEGTRFRQSSAKVLLTEHPRALYEKLTKGQKTTEAMERGSLLDYVAFGRDDLYEPVDTRYRSGERQGEPVTDWSTKDAQKERKRLRALGVLPVLPCQLEAVAPRAQAIRDRVNEFARERSAAVCFQQRIVWTSELGVQCEGTPDVYLTDLDGSCWVIDVKETDPDPRVLSSQISKMAWDVQGAAYEEAVNHWIPSSQWRGHWILACDPNSDEMCFRELDRAFMMLGRQRWAAAQQTWETCLATNVWPGHGDGTIAPKRWAVVAAEGDTIEGDNEAGGLSDLGLE